MNKFEKRISLSPIRSRQYRLKYINENGKVLNQYSKNSPELTIHYRRNYVRFRKSSSRSRSRDNSKYSRRYSSIDYRKKIIFLLLQIIVCLHFSSIIYCHKKQSNFVVKYTIITLIIFNFLAYSCVQYDTQQAESAGLLLGENPLLLLIWYGGIIGGLLALITEKHKHLRSQAFTYRLRFILLFNSIWPFLTYIFYMCRNEFYFIEDSGASSSISEA